MSLLPIQTEGETNSKAREKALKIFETINDRGLSLSNSDILKSAIYYKSNKDNETELFIKKWKEIEEDSKNIGFSLDRIFKIYSYMIRGQEGIKSPEIGLREFFIEKDYSPIKTKNHIEIMDDIIKIINNIELFQVTRDTDGDELSKWLQLIDVYTNNFPKDLMIIFLITNKDKSETIRFAKSLVRYCYFKGSTTRIKNYIYELTINVVHHKWEEYYPKEIPENKFKYFGRLHKGFGLLGAYLSEGQKSVYPYSIKRMRDIVNYWTDEYSTFDNIGNAMPCDVSSNEIGKKSSKFEDLNNIAQNKEWSEELNKRRIETLKHRYLEFFRKPNDN